MTLNKPPTKGIKMINVKQALQVLDYRVSESRKKMGVITFDCEFLHSDEYKVQVMRNQIAIMQGVNLCLEKPA